MNLAIFGHYSFSDGYYAYGKYFKKYFNNVSFFPLIEFSEKKINCNLIESFIKGESVLNFSKNLINIGFGSKDFVIIAHNNEALKNIKVNDFLFIDFIKHLKDKYSFKLIQINWDPCLKQVDYDHIEYFDLCFCSDPYYLKYPNAKFFLQGYSKDSSFYSKDEKYSCDVSFVGTNLYEKDEFPNKKLNRKIILDKISENSEINLNIYGPDFLRKIYPRSYKGFIKYDDCYKVFSNSKINLNISPLDNIEYFKNFYFSERLPQIFACESVMLCNNNFKNFLKPNVDYIYLEDIENLISIIKTYLSDTDLYNRMKKNVILNKKKFNYEQIVNSICEIILKK